MGNWGLILLIELGVVIATALGVVLGEMLTHKLLNTKAIVYTLDLNLQEEGESMADFVQRAREQNLGQYEVI
jgi:hypothetical protein